MNVKYLFGFVILGILMVSSLGNLSAGEIKLWLSSDNSMGHHGSYNMVQIESAKGKTADNKTIPFYRTVTEDGGPVYLNIYSGQYTPLYYNGNEKITDVEFKFDVRRMSGNTKVYTRNLFPTFQLPVYDGLICGVSKNNEYVGMKFWADNHYPGPSEVKMDTVHCSITNTEIFNCPGGKYHEPQTWTVNYPNGQVWN